MLAVDRGAVVTVGHEAFRVAQLPVAVDGDVRGVRDDAAAGFVGAENDRFQVRGVLDLSADGFVGGDEEHGGRIVFHAQVEGVVGAVDAVGAEEVDLRLRGHQGLQTVADLLVVLEHVEDEIDLPVVVAVLYLDAVFSLRERVRQAFVAAAVVDRFAVDDEVRVRPADGQCQFQRRVPLKGEVADPEGEEVVGGDVQEFPGVRVLQRDAGHDLRADDPVRRLQLHVVGPEGIRGHLCVVDVQEGGPARFFAVEKRVLAPLLRQRLLRGDVLGGPRQPRVRRVVEEGLRQKLQRLGPGGREAGEAAAGVARHDGVEAFELLGAVAAPNPRGA